MEIHHRQGTDALARAGTSQEGRDDPVAARQDPASRPDTDLAGEARRTTGTPEFWSSPRPGPTPVDDGVRVLLAVPTRGTVWFETANALAPYGPQYVREKLSVASGRNRIVREFLKTEAEILVMCDDDVIPPPDFVENLVGCPYDVIGAPVPIAKMPAHEVFLNVFQVTETGAIRTIEVPPTGHVPVDAVGSGLIAIHRRVLEHPDLTHPFEQQLDDDGVILVGQDLRFCQRVKDAGFTVGVCMEAMCDHFISLHANAIAMAYRGRYQEAA